VLPGDIGAELARVIAAAVAAGELPPAAGTSNAAGTWRPPPGQSGAAPGAYSSSLPFQLAAGSGRGARDIAALLAAGLRGRPWIGAASATGPGYLTVTVTPGALANLAVRVSQAGPACARSDALRGLALRAPGDAGLVTAPTWAQAHRQLTGAVSGRLARAAGAQVSFRQDCERMASRAATAEPGPGPGAAAVAFAGPDAVRYALARIPAGRCVVIDAAESVKHVLGNPFYAVSFAHADASATLCRAAGLGLGRGEPGRFRPGLLACPAERALLGVISWLPERVAGAARRRQPHELTRYMEHLAGAYLDARERCPALPSGGLGAPRDAATASARLWLADAVRASLGAGLGLLGVRGGPSLPSMPGAQARGEPADL
jgi:arginyl-tRNA synthetase